METQHSKACGMQQNIESIKDVEKYVEDMYGGCRQWLLALLLYRPQDQL